MTLEFWRPRHDEERRALAWAVAAERPAFVVHAGDLVCHGSRAADWSRFLEDFAPVFDAGIPCFPALGNHDYYGGNAAALARRDEVFPHVAGRRWFELRFRSAAILVLDSNLDELSTAEAAAQDVWFRETLAAAEADAGILYILVIAHHPPYTNAKGLGESREVQERFVAKLTPKVRVLASGHVHAYEHFLRNGVHFLVSGGGGGPQREVETEAPKREDLHRGSRGRHYVRFTLEGPRLRVEVLMLGADGAWTRVDGFEC